MNEMEFKPNSHAYKNAQRKPDEPRKKVEKVVNGTVRTVKKSWFSNILDVLGADDIKNDVIIPSVKKAVSTIIKEGTDRALGTYSSTSQPLGFGNVSYRNFYDVRSNPVRQQVDTKNKFNYDNIVLGSRGEADLVLSQLDDIIASYGQASVMDLYELVGVRAPFTADKYGWYNIASAGSKRVSDGYLLVLPPARPID